MSFNVLDNPAVSASIGGALTSGTWIPVPSIFRLRLTGTGTVTLDSRTKAGVITTALGSYTAASATDQIEFPFAGIGAVEVRGTFPATMTVEVI